MARGNPKNATPPSGEPEHRVVTAIIYSKRGGILREWPGFVIGRDKVGHGLSMSMGAARFIDAETGELVRAWDPWNLLDGDR